MKNRLCCFSPWMLVLEFDMQGEGWCFHSTCPREQDRKSRSKPPAAASYMILLPYATLCKPRFPAQAGTGEPR